MEKQKERIWLWLAFLWIAISVLSMFISVISYTTEDGTTRYAIQDLVDGKTFAKEVLSKYTGKIIVRIGSWALTLLCVVSVCAIAAALTGLMIMSKQRPVRWPFFMTLIGVIGTAIPALTILVATILSVKYFPGRISPGLYPIVTMFAVLFSLCIVIRERRRIKKSVADVKRNALIRPAGDL